MTKDEQLLKVLRIHNRGRLLGALLVPGSLWLIMTALAPATGIMWWTFFVLLSLVGYFLFSAAAMVVAVFIVAAMHPSSSPKEEKSAGIPEMKVETATITIVETPEPFGSLGNMPIFDWMDVKLGGTDEIRRCEYVTTVTGELEQALLPESCIIVPPGIVYKLV